MEVKGMEYIYEMLIGYWVTGVLRSAIELEVFTKISQGFKTVGDLASAIRASERGTRILLDALSGLGLLLKDMGVYKLAPVAEKFLVKEREYYVGDASFAFAPPPHFQVMCDPIEAIKSGKPIGPELTPEFWQPLVESLIPLSFPVVPSICHILGITSGMGLKILDIGCGSGCYGYGLLKHDPTSKMVALDQPAVLEVAARVAQMMGVGDRVTYMPGDLFELDYGEEKFDLAIISNVLTAYNPQRIRHIFGNAHRAIRSGGNLMINEIIADEERSKNRFALLFAMYMFVVAPEGDTYTFTELSDWLKDAGFMEISLHEISGPSAIIMAKKP